MSRFRHITADPRYLEFVERYAFDPLRFAIEVVGMTPTWQQADMLNEIAVPGARVSVSSGHGCFAAGTEIMMADGRCVPVEHVRVGDRLMGPDGASTREVIKLARGREAMHRIRYGDGSHHDVNESHLLCVVEPDGSLNRISVGRYLAMPPSDRAGLRCYRLKEPASGYAPARYTKLEIFSVEPLGEGDYFGFTLDGDGLFLGADRTVLSNTGKTNAFGLIALWHLVCYVRSNTFITAPKLGTVQEGVWKEFAGHHAAIKRGPHAWIADHIMLEHEKVYIRGSKLDWFITARTAPRGKPESLAGSHNQWLLWLADEASGIPDENFGVIGGALTDANNRFLIASQPTRDSGFFRETHNRLSREQGGPWVALVFNSEDSPLVSDQFIRDKMIEYGGRDSPEYMIKVRGLFPEYSDKYLLSRRHIEACIDAKPVIDVETEEFGNLIVVDVAAGVYRDRTVATHFRVKGYGDRLEPVPRRIDMVDIPVYTNSLDWQEVSGRVRDYCLHVSNPTVVVDVGGQGVQFAKMLRKLDVPNVIAANWGKPCFLKRNKERFANLRAQCSVQAAEAVKDGRVTLRNLHRKDLIDQGSRIPFYFGERGEWHIMSKVDMAKEGIPSPDLWDTVCMAFLEDVHYLTDDGSASAVTDAHEAARKEAEDAFAGV